MQSLWTDTTKTSVSCQAICLPKIKINGHNQRCIVNCRHTESSLCAILKLIWVVLHCAVCNSGTAATLSKHFTLTPQNLS